MQGDKVLEMHGLKKHQYRFWVNGVDIPNTDIDLDKEMRAQYSSKNIIFMASQLKKEKGVHQMIKAMPAIIDKNKDALLIIAGTGEQLYSLQKMAERLGVLGHVEFLGAVDYNKLSAYFKLADIFVSLYTYSNIGNPTLEAMAWGKCIVTLNHFDTNKFITENKTGRLLDDQQLDSLPDVIVDLLSDPEKRKTLGNNAREFAMRNFWTWETRVDEEIKEIERLISESRKN
jgi:glycosyltransferase involved in cell wall biosynthesis